MKKILAILLIIMICFTTVCYGATYNTVTIAESTYSYYADGSAPEYNKHAIFKSSTGNPVYCGNHGLPTLVGDNIGDSKSLQLYEYNNESVRKVLYYGYLGPKEWSGFSQSKYNGVYKAGSTENKRKWCGNAVTGIALTKTQGKGYFYNISGFEDFWAYIKNAPTPPKGFKVYIMYGGSNEQDLFTWTYNPQGILKIKKISASNSELIKECPEQYSLGGAEYLISTDVAGSNIVGTLITNEDGSSNEIELKTGTYYVKERVAPKGFGIDKTTYKINVEEDKTNTLNVKDEPLFDPMNLLLMKSDSKTGEGLEGAIFKVNYYKKLTEDVSGETPSKTWLFKTDSRGRISLNENYKIGGDQLYTDENGNPVGLIGTYEFIEIEAPFGYAKDEGSIIRQVKEDEVTGNTTIYNSPRIINISQTVSINLQKYDESLGTSKNADRDLSGAVYQVKNELGEVVGEIVTDRDGNGEITGLKPGKYTLLETKAPVGYLINSNEIVVDAIADDPNLVHFNYCVEAGDYPTITSILKYETKDNQKISLSGAKMQIVNNDGEIVEEFISSKDPYEIKYLPIGNYVLKEIEAPKGYQLAKDVEFEVKNDEEITIVEMENVKEKVKENITNVEDNDLRTDIPSTGDNDRNFISYKFFRFNRCF